MSPELIDRDEERSILTAKTEKAMAAGGRRPAETLTGARAEEEMEVGGGIPRIHRLLPRSCSV
jgi:hypothetical protein